MIIFYHLFLLVYKAGIHIVSLGNRKAKLWISGRKNVFKKLQITVSAFNGKKVVWMHCASLGEFEQGRPVLQKIKQSNSNAEIIISFFSPSGFEIVKNNKEFKNIFYLPMDSKLHAEKWMNIVKPDLVLWVKYEYWHYYLDEIRKRQVPLIMVSGIYRKSQTFFKWYGGFYRNMLTAFTHFFVQNESSKEQLQKLVSIDKITVSGDTRCDRVIDIANNFKDIPGIVDFCEDKKVVVAGSTWEEDESEWTHFVKSNPELRFVIAPHEIDEENLEHVQKEFAGSVFYSDWMEDRQQFKEQAPNCLIIDNIGMLSRLYYYAAITFVGGGFGDDGLHNILEAAVYGKPVIFGPEYDKNFEAEELIECGGAIAIENAVELEKVVNHLLSNEQELLMRSNAAKKYVYKNAGATDKIFSFIKMKNLL